MAQTESCTGRFGTATIGTAPAGITRWEGTLHKELADATDSNNFDTASGQIYQSQAYGVIGIDGTLEGNYDLAGSTKTNLINNFTTDGPHPVVLMVTRTETFASFSADFSDVRFSLSVPGSTMVTWSCSFKSNGTVTFGP